MSGDLKLSYALPIRPVIRHLLTNGELLKAAEEAGFEVFLTPDKNIRYQQNLVICTIELIVFGNPQWPALRHHVDRVEAAVNAAIPGTSVVVEMPEA